MPRLYHFLIRVFASSLVWFTAVPSLASEDTLEVLKKLHDKCHPVSVGQRYENPLYGADFVWFSDGDAPCSNGPSQPIITNYVINLSQTDLIFNWPKGEIWAEKAYPLPQGFPGRGGPRLVADLNQKPDYNAPIKYTQSYTQVAPAAAYAAESDKAADLKFKVKSELGKLESQVRTAARGKEGIIEVAVNVVSVLNPEKQEISTNVSVTPVDAIVAVSGIPQYLRALLPETRRLAAMMVGNWFKKYDAKFTIERLKDIMREKSIEYAPKALLEREYLSIDVNDKIGSVAFTLPTPSSDRGKFNIETITAKSASIVVLGV